MTPKEKAEDLFGTYRYALSLPNAPLGQHKDNIAKQCALIAIDEIIKSNPHDDLFKLSDIPTSMNYWEQIKQEIKKL